MRKRVNRIVVEWDVNKEKANIQKHKIDFETAMLVFADKNRIEFYDSRHSVYENRYVTIGLINNIVTVIYAERRKSVRIISARKATAEERRKYYGESSQESSKAR